MGTLKDKWRRRIFGTPQSLIAGLLDPSVGWALRDDYAGYLIPYDEPEVEDALFHVASNPAEDDDIAESCGEAVAEIWCRKGKLQVASLHKLKAAALVEALAIISVRKPEWISILRAEGLVCEES